MSEIIDTLVDGLLDREADVGSTVTLGGVTVPCSGGSSRDGKALDIGGFRPDASVVIVVRVAVLGVGSLKPLPKQSVSYVSEPGAAAKSLRIDNLTLLYNELLVLECNDPAQGS